jgi:hypothetical protein
MINEIWYGLFMDALFERHPKKSRLAEALMELLHIEREAVYRRLRNEVIFSAYEIVKISSTWNISLDNILNMSSGKIPFLMQAINYAAPSEQDLMFLQRINQSINEHADFPDAEFMNVCNKLPCQLLAGFEYLNRFYLFKWMYQYGNEKKPVLFAQVTISEEMIKLTSDYYLATKNVPQTNLMFDLLLFDHLVNEIRYFHSIQMITDEEKDLIKRDLYGLLDYLSEVATDGCYPETQNKVNLYVSQLNVDTNYSYTYTKQLNICFVHAFDKFEIYSYDKEMATNFRKWMQLKKRTSIHISGLDEKGKKEFFQKQRQTVDGL